MNYRALSLAVLALSTLLVCVVSRADTHVDIIHRVIVSQPAFSAEPIPETAEARSHRLRLTAKTLYASLRHRPRGVSWHLWAGALITLGQEETHWALYVHDDKCETGPHKCDNGRAKGFWQAHQSACPGLWTIPSQTDEWHYYAADCASRRLASHYNRCARWGDPLAGAFSGYATGGRGEKAGCVWEEGKTRAERARGIGRKL